MKLILKEKWIFFEVALLFIAIILYSVDKEIGIAAFWVWGLLLAGIPFCINECLKEKKGNKNFN